MSNRDALRRLSKQVPATPEIEKIMDSLQGKEDMPVAIMAVSIVEATLERLIASRMIKKNKDLLSRLFDNRGPLSDFNSKILMPKDLVLLQDH